MFYLFGFLMEKATPTSNGYRQVGITLFVSKTTSKIGKDLLENRGKEQVRYFCYRPPERVVYRAGRCHPCTEIENYNYWDKILFNLNMVAAGALRSCNCCHHSYLED